jgi:hypothetical protein
MDLGSWSSSVVEMLQLQVCWCRGFLVSRFRISVSIMLLFRVELILYWNKGVGALSCWSCSGKSVDMSICEVGVKVTDSLPA